MNKLLNPTLHWGVFKELKCEMPYLLTEDSASLHNDVPGEKCNVDFKHMHPEESRKLKAD